MWGGGPEIMVVSGTAASTVQVCAAGEGSVLPAGSVARTRNVCEPSARPVSVLGDVHAAHAPESRRHSNVAPVSEAKLNVADRRVRSTSVVVNAVPGATVSTDQTADAGD